MNVIGSDAGKYFKHAPVIYPECSACDVVILRIKEACVVEVEDDDVHVHPSAQHFICCQCFAIAEEKLESLKQPCTLEELKEVTNAEERICARKDAFERDKAERATMFRKERAQKAADKRAEKKAATGNGTSSRKARSKSNNTRRKKTRTKKV